MNKRTFAELAAHIKARRDCGDVILYQVRVSALPERDAAGHIDEMVASLGLTPLGQAWHEFTRDQATNAATAILWRDLAYGADIMPRPEASGLAAELLTPCPADTRFFTNFPDVAASATGEGSGFAWSPLTNHTFDAAIVAVGGGQLTLFCVADED